MSPVGEALRGVQPSKVHQSRPMESDKCGRDKAGRLSAINAYAGPAVPRHSIPGHAEGDYTPSLPHPPSIRRYACMVKSSAYVLAVHRMRAKSHATPSTSTPRTTDRVNLLVVIHFCFRPLHQPLRPSSAVLCGSCMCARMTLRSSSIRRRPSELSKRGVQRDQVQRGPHPPLAPSHARSPFRPIELGSLVPSEEQRRFHEAPGGTIRPGGNTRLPWTSTTPRLEIAAR